MTTKVRTLQSNKPVPGSAARRPFALFLCAGAVKSHDTPQNKRRRARDGGSAEIFRNPHVTWCFHLVIRSFDATHRGTRLAMGASDGGSPVRSPFPSPYRGQWFLRGRGLWSYSPCRVQPIGIPARRKKMSCTDPDPPPHDVHRTISSHSSPLSNKNPQCPVQYRVTRTPSAIPTFTATSPRRTILSRNRRCGAAHGVHPSKAR